ncbi:MAG: DUF4250 domain-containing protein [Prevotellaceae bacterium]|nr:DUF4250 domain-containing protein [Prevotellaceae bacterium]
MNELPNDPAILLSLVNTWLRDNYESLEALCTDKKFDATELTERLAAAGFTYNPQQNRFW